MQPTEATCHWIFVQHSRPLRSLENFAMQYAVNALKRGSPAERWICRKHWFESEAQALLSLLKDK
jgi:hypothetical protein